MSNFSFKFLLFIFLLMSAITAALAQEIVNGRILDINTHQPVPYVNIFFENRSTGTISDFAGRFSLKLAPQDSSASIIFQHINYERKSLLAKELPSPLVIYLQPRIIPLPEVKIFAPSEKPEIKKDIPLMIKQIETQQAGVRGYVDAGDFLASDEAVQIEETLSGSKSISLRGGNADDVIILYNGLKITNQFSYFFDLSLIDLTSVKRIDLVKGSNSVLYGSGAFSGIVNIVPQVEQDFKIRFQQRIGSYDSGDWDLQLYGQKKNLHLNYNVSQGGSRRFFDSNFSESGYLENKSELQNIGLEYRFANSENDLSQNRIQFFFLDSQNSYFNASNAEKVRNYFSSAQMGFNGSLFKLQNINCILGLNRSHENQSLNNSDGWLVRNIKTNSLMFSANKLTNLQGLDLLISYQFENHGLSFENAQFDFLSNQVSGEIDEIRRFQQSLAAVIKLHGDGGSQFVQNVDFDLSYRYDFAADKQNGNNSHSSLARKISRRNWRYSSVKFASRFHGIVQRFLLDIFMNIGNNLKLPTLAQLISAHISNPYLADQKGLSAEKNRGVELGIILKREIADHPSIYGWEISASYLNNNFANKLRPYFVIGLPLAFYDNVPDARLSGFELKASAFLFKKKITAETGISSYAISDKAAFPFKSADKKIINISIDHNGYSFLAHWFQEGEQIGWVRELNGRFNEVILPRFTNIDLHFSKDFTWKYFKIFFNLSLRNLLADRTRLQGLALHDRRYYITAGIQY